MLKTKKLLHVRNFIIFLLKHEVGPILRGTAAIEAAIIPIEIFT